MYKRDLSFSLLLLAIFCFSFAVNGQTSQVTSVAHEKLVIKSKVLGQDRTVLVRVPANYARTSEKFPVVYMLDAHAPQNGMMAGLIEHQAWGEQMPEMILVGIQNIDRTHDMTPTKFDRLPTSGGADKFLQFIETELIPFIEKNYRTQPFKIIAGHSFGGLFAVYTFVTRPELFNSYIAASPVLSWGQNFVINRAEDLFKQNKNWNKTMFVSLGDETDLAKGFNSFKELLERTNPPGFNYEFRHMPEENHSSVILQSYYRGLRKTFTGWNPPQTNLLTDLESHYKKLSDRFGYKVPISEDLMNRIGYQFLRTGKTPEAINIFKRNVDTYPGSANAYDSLGDAYEKSGQLKQAEEYFEKAYKMAEAQGDELIVKNAKAKYERVSSKSK